VTQAELKAPVALSVPALPSLPAPALEDDPACDSTEELQRPSVGSRIASLLVVVVPFLGLIAAIFLLWGVAFSWVHLALLTGGYLLTGLGITVGYHRLFTHRSFETSATVRAILGVLGSMAIEGSIMRWVATHRRHHQHSDSELDPHSPNTHGSGVLAVLRGFWHSHVGWFFDAEPRDLVTRYVPDLMADRVTRVVSKLFLLWVVLSLAVPGLIAWAITGTVAGGLLGVLWGGVVRVFFVHHITWSINSVCHLWGSRPYRSHDLSRNNVIFGVLGFGEGWHNNHHAFPTSARHGLHWWQFDSSYWVIRLMAMVGLARNVRVPSRDRIQAKMAH
jgi:stearoyl-CoA desaturase (Delta-9 desaturase)